MPQVAEDAYRIELVQVRTGWIWQAVTEALVVRVPTDPADGQSATPPLAHMSYGEYEVLSMRRAAGVEDVLDPPASREGQLSVHLMPLFGWNVGNPGLELDPGAAEEFPLLAVFALKVAADWPDDLDAAWPMPSADGHTVFSIAQEVRHRMVGPKFVVCAGIGFFEITALLQTNRVTDVRQTLENLHRMGHPHDPNRPAFCAVSPVCAMRAVAVGDAEHPAMDLPHLEDVEGTLGAHICLGYRAGRFDDAVKAGQNEDPHSMDLQVARYDLEVVLVDKSMADIAKTSLHLHAWCSEELEHVRTALSFPLVGVTQGTL